ncbi:MAG: 30S ribosomal protein S18 [Candidatus Levybacteria bacterium RIFCSPHIGHO2_02_FULL_37_13]|nr:MAG: 30S ribosomal protein S18 [Candidatus Levybacteria bacterium RIFCSPHIGHO2_02_FULL_37_13]OGH39764.1 MAG: 30S ribosomal protein S18 [Candidatus Levybacteria bacterium RIFCSPLOWO2_01_FULL_37_26]
MKRAKKDIRRRKKISVPKECFFCKEKTEPYFFDTPILQRFLTQRGKIVPGSRNGLCSKHQRAVALNIKYSRHLSLLPFVSRE